MIYKEAPCCRVCGGGLELVLDLGSQCLGGQFPKAGDPDPPSVPLRLMRCGGCGLAQLGHTVDPSLMFRSYGYCSGVTQTMRAHLMKLAVEACSMLPDRRLGMKILDIGGNDGTLLSYLDGEKYIIDPSDVPTVHEENVRRHKGFFPQDVPADWKKFDLIFTVACFYDADNPVAFAKAVAERLAPSGLWCVEVASAGRMVRDNIWDGITHEHLCYYDAGTFQAVCEEAGMHVVRWEANNCNGGSIRLYVSLLSEPSTGHRSFLTKDKWTAFADHVRRSIDAIGYYLYHARTRKTHLLGASTKANTWLQAIENVRAIDAASERDPRKHGCWTPGTHIPIIGEEASRAMRPDVYLVGPWHFRNEIIEKENEFLNKGGRLVFPLPRLNEVKR